jgi:hypothetical protein
MHHSGLDHYYMRIFTISNKNNSTIDAHKLFLKFKKSKVIYYQRLSSIFMFFLLVTFSATTYYLPSNKTPKAPIIKEGININAMLIGSKSGYSKILKNDSFYCP